MKPGRLRKVYAVEMGGTGWKEVMSRTETSKGSGKSLRLGKTLGQWKEVTKGTEVRKARDRDRLGSF